MEPLTTAALGRPPLPDRDYFNIGEASRIAQVPEYTLRYWETQFRALRPVRRESGHRRYTRRDMEAIFRIKELLQDRKMTVEGARRALLARAAVQRQSPARGIEMNAQALKLLRGVREELREIIAELSR